MKVYCADDSPVHLDRIERAFRIACSNRADVTIVRFPDGQQLIDRFQREPADMVSLDINMPELDGLSALVRLRRLDQHCPVVMVSAENRVVIKRLASVNRFDAPEAKRHLMLNKVINRVKEGFHEQGKINSVLEACASLGLDPVEVARQHGAHAFLHKPYEPEEAARLLRNHLPRDNS